MYGFEMVQERECSWPCLASYRKKDQNLFVVSITDDMLPYYEMAFFCGADDNQIMNARISLFSELGCRMLFVTWESKDEVHVLFGSDTSKVRALEFMDYLMADLGLIQGDAKCATGFMEKTFLSIKMQENLADPVDYFLKMTQSYFTQCDCIDCKDYLQNNQTEILQMAQFHKRKVMWAVVKTTDVADPGEEIWFKSLENESGLLLVARDEVYIMVGCRGEIYHIQKSKFDISYEESEESLYVFEQMLDMVPEIIRKKDESYVNLDEVAHLCYPKIGPGIYAKRLDRRTKVFPVNSEEYFLGRPGDYLAVRCDDLSDMYIIQGDIFVQTYERNG